MEENGEQGGGGAGKWIAGIAGVVVVLLLCFYFLRQTGTETQPPVAFDLAKNQNKTQLENYVEPGQEPAPNAKELADAPETNPDPQAEKAGGGGAATAAQLSSVTRLHIPGDVTSPDTGTAESPPNVSPPPGQTEPPPVETVLAAPSDVNVDLSVDMNGSDAETPLFVHKVFFPFDTYTLTDAEISDIVATLLPQTSTTSRIVVEGHSSWSGPDLYNLDLSQKRARAVEAVIKKNLCFDKCEIKDIAYGEARPISPEAAKNRRVLIRVY